MHQSLITDVSSVVGAPWRCGVLMTQGGIAWDWVGPPTWWRACFNSPEWGGGSSPAETEPPQIVLLLLLLRFAVVVEVVVVVCFSVGV